MTKRARHNLTRDDLLEQFYARRPLTAADAPPVPPAPVAAPAEDDVDKTVDQDIDAIIAGIQQAITDQGGDDNTQPDDAKVLELLQAMLVDAQKLKAAQAADVTDDSDGVPGPAGPVAPAAPAAPAPAAPAAASIAPGTPRAEGLAVPPGPATPPVAAPGPPAEPPAAPGKVASSDVADDVQCLDPACQHLASAHTDQPAPGPGKNTGVCTMANCACKGMRVPDEDAVGDGPNPTPPGPAEASVQLASDVASPSTQTPGVTGSPNDDGSGTGPAPGPDNGGEADGPGPSVPLGPLDGPQFTIPVGVIEGISTSDGRSIAPGALTWRNPPLPLMILDETNEFGHAGAFIGGRCDVVTRADGGIISATGYFDTSAEALEAARMVDNQMLVGVSADIANMTSEITIVIGPDGEPSETELITAGEIVGFTACPFPALEGAYIVLGDGSDSPAPIPQTPDAVQASLGIHVVNAKACAPCEQGLPVVASGGPLAPPAEWFADPELPEPTKLTIDTDGRVYGHLAAWGVCHTAAGGGACVTAPMGSDYRLFRTGYVVCADGSEVPTGPITSDTGHADTSPRTTAAAAMAHYDNTGHAVADCAIGEDEHGIWLAGAMRPTATDEQVHAMRASSVSGDWRPIGGRNQLELVAALAVNRPGFPLTKAVKHDGELTSLVAAGMVFDVDVPAPTMPTAEERLAALEMAYRPLAETAAAKVRAEFTALQGA